MFPLGTSCFLIFIVLVHVTGFYVCLSNTVKHPFVGTKMWVIEVNPFLETTDGALFSWNHERTILEGSQEFVFRITEKPRPGAKTILPQSVRGLLEEKI